MNPFYVAEIKYSLALPTGETIKDTYMWVGYADSYECASTLAIKDVKLIKKYHDLKPVSYDILEVSVGYYDKCGECGGTGVLTTMYGESWKCPRCNGKKIQKYGGNRSDEHPSI